MMEELQIKTRRMAAEGRRLVSLCILEQQRLHRLNPPKPESSTSKSNFSSPSLCEEDQCVFSVPLQEDEIVDDLLFMAHSTGEQHKHLGIPQPCIVAPLSSQRLLLNDKVIRPNTPCVLLNNGVKVYDCVFASTVVKEKDKRDPEVSSFGLS